MRLASSLLQSWSNASSPGLEGNFSQQPRPSKPVSTAAEAGAAQAQRTAKPSASSATELYALAGLRPEGCRSSDTSCQHQVHRAAKTNTGRRWTRQHPDMGAHGPM